MFTVANSSLLTILIISIYYVSGVLSQIEEDCLCRGIYYSGIVNTLSSCECNQGMKAILVKYTGNVVLKELIFYFSTNREYEKCSFTNIQPNDILECISYPYSKFVSDVMIKMISSDINDIDNNCISSIHTSCSMNILDLSPSGCNNLNIVGWIDGSDHICKSLQAQSFQPNNYLDTGRRILIRRLDSSSSSNSESSDDSSDDIPTPTKTTKTTETTTSTTMILTTGSLINSYCECDSVESWDDYYYYDLDGNIKEFPRNTDEIARANPGRTHKSELQNENNDKIILKSSNMMNANKDGSNGYIINISLYFLLNFLVIYTFI